MRTNVRVAAAQYAIPPFDTAAGVEKVCAALSDAASQGVELVVFSETFLGGYPYWRGHVSVSQETELAARLWAAAVVRGDASIAAISAAARQYGVGAVVGANERDDRPGSGTFFNSQLFFTPDEGYVGSHRKLVPTHTERAYWGAGTAEDVKVVDYPGARVGALICYEHHMLAARLALTLAGEEIHCAAWPGYWATGRHLADKIPGPATHAEIDAVVRDYALTAQSFVVSANAYLPTRVIPSDLASIMGYNLARGGSAIVDPSGRYLIEPVLDEDALIVADCALRDRSLAKAYLDTVGHYSRWDIFDFSIHNQPQTAPARPERRPSTRLDPPDPLPADD